MIWDPAIYTKFAGPRMQPALDLLARVPAQSPATVADLGCGTGNIAKLLAARWPDAEITGIDSSPEMLAEAAKAGVRTVLADAGSWAPERKVDVLFSNAALHWLDDHAALFPKLLGHVAAGGVLAVQMPRNHGAASHTCMVEAARSGPWAAKLEPVLRPSPVAEPSYYYDVLSPLAASLDVWETEYLHVLDGDNPVVQWTMGTALRPLLEALDGDDRAGFLEVYADLIRQAYPPRRDGKTLFPFRRLFLVAVR